MQNNWTTNWSTIIRKLGQYDTELLKKYLTDNKTIIETKILDELRQCNINRATRKLNLNFQEAHWVSKKKICNLVNAARIYMEVPHVEFDNYQKSDVENSADTPEEGYEK